MLCKVWTPSPTRPLGVWLSFLASIALVSSTRLVKHDVHFLPDIVLRVTVDTINLNCQQRLPTLVNGTYPGPPIYLEPEQTTWIRVYNDADVNTTIVSEPFPRKTLAKLDPGQPKRIDDLTQHWHGLSQNLFPFSDGSPEVSQWPIPPGHFFDYELYPPSDLAGTLFYHSHVGFQATTATGPLIVKDAQPPPYAYDDELMLFIGDPLALQINGQSGNAPSPQTPNPSDTSCQPHEFDVEPDTTYRVRVIGATAISLVTFAVEDYDNLTIIETDSSYVYPVETDHIQVDSGQRFSFILHTKSTSDLQGKTSSWIQFETRAGKGVVTAWAKLNYNTPNSEAGPVARRDQPHTSPNSNPQSQPQPQPQPQSPSPSSLALLSPSPSPSPIPLSTQTANSNPNFVPSSPLIALPTSISSWLEYTFRTLSRYGTAPPSSAVTRRVIISTGQILNQTTGHTLFPSNNEVWLDSPSPPLGPTTTIPYLVEILGNGTINGTPPDLGRALANQANPGFDPISHTYPASIGDVLEIVWQNSASQPAGVYGVHPMHAHGGPYWDMGSGPGVYSPEAHEALLAQAQAQNVAGWTGSRRDTTILYTYDDAASTATGAGDGEGEGEDGETQVNGWRVWRVQVTTANIGVWVMHCHILQHMIMGQQTVWVFGTPEEIVANAAPVDGNLDRYFTYGGDVVGKAGSTGSEGVTLVSKSS